MKWNVCWLMDQKPGHLTKIKGVLKALRYHVELDIQQIPISGKHTFATQAKAVLKKLSSPRQLQQPTTTERKPTARGQIIIR